ncbi:beta-N-acetylhexosaminidase [Conexibacter sp. W3-3-2]|nr:beta-N-acetylhexosaminidase [Conexibacter sp. W3-3-2]
MTPMTTARPTIVRTIEPPPPPTADAWSARSAGRFRGVSSPLPATPGAASATGASRSREAPATVVARAAVRRCMEGGSDRRRGREGAAGLPGSRPAAPGLDCETGRMVDLARRPSQIACLVALTVAVPACGAGRDDDPRPRAQTTAAPRALNLASLTPGQLAGQRLVATFRDTQVPGPAIRRLIRRGELGAVILFTSSAPTVARARRISDELQALARRSPVPVPLLVTIDQEGGDGRTTGAKRLNDAPPYRSAQQQAAGGVATVRASGVSAGRALRRAGVNVNLAPVADVGRPRAALTNEGRSYGSSAATVGRLTAAFVQGQGRSGVASTLKHFPGFGAAAVNTDFGVARIGLSAATLRRVDEAAFRPGVRAGAQLVMLSNAIYPALDPLPAPLSRRIAVGELRERFGFRGVSITDDLEADALRSRGTPAQLAVRAARAGVDLAILGRRAQSAVDAHAALTREIATGRLPRAEAEASAQRVLALRTGLRR